MNQIVDDILEIAQGLVLLLVSTFAILIVASVTYGIWESIMGWAFHVERNFVAIVVAIGLCAMQIRNNK